MNEINVIASFPSKTHIFSPKFTITSSLSSSRSLTWFEQELHVACFSAPCRLPRHSAFVLLLLNLALSLLMRKTLLEGGKQERKGVREVREVERRKEERDVRRAGEGRD